MNGVEADRSVPMRKMSILVADGETLYRESICAVVAGQQDMRVAGRARSTEELVAKAEKYRPDVIFMEQAMDNGNAHSAVRALKNDGRDVKVLLVSQFEDEAHIISGLMSGCDGYIPKRASAVDLIAAARVVHSGGFYLYPSVARVVITECVERSRSLKERE